MNEIKYMPRLVDKKISTYLTIFGAVSIEGPKWCGKTWTSTNHSKSIVYMDEKENIEIAKLNAANIFEKDLSLRPQLIDEWHLVPSIWDAVRRECDRSLSRGNFILTASTTLPEKKKKEEIKHSGTGRIARINMYTMSLYESGFSNGKASIMDMYNNTQELMYNGKVDIELLASLIIRGGWPANTNIPMEHIGIIPKNYIESVLTHDISEEKKLDKNKMRMLLKSLARNESTVVSNNTIISDIEEHENGNILLTSRNTVSEYLDVLDRLHLIENQDAYSVNYRSPERVGKSPKRHFTDPSLACACMDLTVDKLLTDTKTFGFMFEALVERDLRIYMDYLEGQLFHFRDSVSGLEVDAILEFPDGEYAAVEIKLSVSSIDDAKKSLLKFQENMLKKPKFMCIIVGNCPSIARDEETGIYILPITALKP